MKTNRKTRQALCIIMSISAYMLADKDVEGDYEEDREGDKTSVEGGINATCILRLRFASLSANM